MTPRIYVASLADYNNANLHGVWIDADQDADTIREEIATMLRASKHPNVEVTCHECAHMSTPGTVPERDALGNLNEAPGTCETCIGTGKVPSAEEYAIHDHEGFEGIEIGEYADLDKVVEHANMLSQHGGAWAAYVGNVGAKYATESGFKESYRGEYDSAEAYAEELISDTYDTKSMGNLANYIDYEKFARDMGFEGWSFVPGGAGVYVFSPD